MTDLAHPAIADTEQITAAEADEPPRSGSPSFSELVHAHHRWQLALRGTSADLDAADRAYRAALDNFESQYGRIVNAYWCSSVESAVALTAKPRRFLNWLVGEKLVFHRVTDWATKGSPDIATELHRCDELAVRAEQVLTGVRRRICLQLVLTSASHLLSLVDEAAAHEDSKLSRQAAIEEKKLLADTSSYYGEAANGQAQIVYFLGMALTTLTVVTAAGLLWGTTGHRSIYGPVIAGVIGANISVVQRINSGQFALEYDVGWPYLIFLGALRPLLGAVFGGAVALAVRSGILRIPFTSAGQVSRTTAEFYALVVIAFVAGFSERWAQDALASSVTVSKATVKNSSGS